MLVICSEGSKSDSSTIERVNKAKAIQLPLADEIKGNLPRGEKIIAPNIQLETK